MSNFRNTDVVKNSKADSPFDLDPLSDAEIENYLDKLNTDQKKKIRVLVSGKTKEMGYSQCREGGTIWDKAQSLIVSDIVRKEIDIDEIEVEVKD